MRTKSEHIPKTSQERIMTMAGLIEYLPQADGLIALGPEDLGMILLQLVQAERTRNVTMSAFEMPLWNANSPGYPQNKRGPVSYAIAEAWQWLQNEGLLMTALDQPNGYFCLTRKGENLKSAADIEAYQYGHILPIDLLHPIIAERVRPMFLRGDYDVAVFQAFKIIEMAVRRAAKLSDSDIGRKLMQAAFGEGRPLSSGFRERDEQVGLMELFSGAIGFCKNPASHRSPGFKCLEAAQLIAFASYLLSQVEEAELISGHTI
jgi:uncharacterized protein (TIGR02391 family)